MSDALATAAPPPISPGTYVRLRREAAGLSLEDVARLVGTVPSWPSHTREEWLALIEADGAPIVGSPAIVLHEVIGFDITVLLALVAIRVGVAGVVAPRLCRVCACSEDDACEGGCYWVAADLCSACIDPIAQVDAIHAAAAAGIADRPQA